MPIEHQRLAAARTGPDSERVRPPVLDLLPLHLEAERLEDLDHDARRRLLVPGEARHADQPGRGFDEPVSIDAHHAS
jgi:hypothetical protein